MKKGFVIFILSLFTIIFVSSAAFPQENVSIEKKSYYDKTHGFKIGMDAAYTSMYWFDLFSISPDIGIAWENWKTQKRGFIVELHAGYAFSLDGTYNKDGTDNPNYFHFSIPIMWGFRPNEHFAFKLGVKPGLIIDTESEIIPFVQMPLCFTYYINKKFHIDLNIGLPATIIIPYSYILVPLQTSAGISIGWRFRK